MENIGNKRVSTRMKIKAMLSCQIARMCKRRYWKQIGSDKKEKQS
jgi:hypothetical protein